MGAFVILEDGRAWHAANWAFDAVLRSVAIELAATREGQPMAAWLLDQRCDVLGLGLGEVDVRSLATEDRSRLHDACLAAWEKAHARGPVGWHDQRFFDGWIGRFRRLLDMWASVLRGEPPSALADLEQTGSPARGIGGPGHETSWTFIRRFCDEDERAVASVWFRAGKAAYAFLPAWQAMDPEGARAIFHAVVRRRGDLWVGIVDTRPVAYMALVGSHIDRLYVDPDEWRRGWGTRFLDLAKTLSPTGLSVRTHQANGAARAFYERNGFFVAHFGTSPPPESAPDVEYGWRP